MAKRHLFKNSVPVVPGGGTALLYASKQLEALKAGAANQDVRVGMEIIQRAIRRPAQTIAQNAGVPGEVVVGKLLESVSFVIALCFFSMLALSFYLLSQYPPWGIAILGIVFTPLARVFDTYRDIRQGLIRLGD